MDKIKNLSDAELLDQLHKLNNLNIELEKNYKQHFNRSLPFPDHISDRWERAKRLGFGEGTSIYDSSYVLGNVKVGRGCWLGMLTVLDGSGGLIIGDYCTISAGVHIYSHDNLKATLTSGKHLIEREKVEVGSNCYIAPNSIIAKGVTLGSFCIVGAQSLVTKSFPSYSIIAGTPARQIGTVSVEGEQIKLEYYK
jgi:acetyltransferase-like isoleucine patch superfamily enzyme